jgi:hypothetical protein
MLPTIEVPAPIEQMASGRAGAPADGAGSADRGGGATARLGLAGIGGGDAWSGLPLKLLSMRFPLVSRRNSGVSAATRRKALAARMRERPDQPWQLPPAP